MSFISLPSPFLVEEIILGKWQYHSYFQSKDGIGWGVMLYKYVQEVILILLFAVVC